MFQLIGTTYGGDGVNTYQLPDLQCRFPVHMGTGFGVTNVIGQKAGVESVTLTTQQMPNHTHVPVGSPNGGTSNVPTNNVWADWTGAQYSNAAPTPAPMRSDSVGLMGGSQPHDNMIPYLALTFVIALYGIFPSQT